MTFLLHVESRTASACGMGFYTIGPCGEEMLGATGEALEETDAVALHYRHLSVNMVRSCVLEKAWRKLFWTAHVATQFHLWIQ